MVEKLKESNLYRVERNGPGGTSVPSGTKAKYSEKLLKMAEENMKKMHY